MKTLLEHLNQVSKERWFKNFRHATDDGRVYMVESIIKEAGKRYAKEVAREALKNAAENAIVTDGESSGHFMGDSTEYGESTYYVDKQSILSEDNIPEL